MEELLNSILLAMMSLLLSYHEAKDNNRIFSAVWMLSCGIQVINSFFYIIDLFTK